MTKIRITERPWSDTMDWSLLYHQAAEFNALKSKYQVQRQSLWSFLTTHLDNHVDNLVKVQTSVPGLRHRPLVDHLRQCSTVHGTFQHVQIRNQLANFKQSTNDSNGTVLSTMPLSKFIILRFQGYVDKLKRHPSKTSLT